MKDLRRQISGRRTTDHQLDSYKRTASHTEYIRTLKGNLIRRRVALTASQFDAILDQFTEADMVFNGTTEEWEKLNAN